MNTTYLKTQGERYLRGLLALLFSHWILDAFELIQFQHSHGPRWATFGLISILIWTVLFSFRPFLIVLKNVDDWIDNKIPFWIDLNIIEWGIPGALAVLLVWAVSLHAPHAITIEYPLDNLLLIIFVGSSYVANTANHGITLR